ncbi:SDR family oxidoreductase [Pantoea sp. 1.19]|uniref:SDR family oxidoreductase n=1 Tax=Pantoea sp. 1.19 TaxID=1925589 RepID=UPI000948F2B3|nr:SDR family oxidoreductase [Pantoea sp. 1.19]
MKRVAIVGLGWLGMPLGMALSARGWQVKGSKTSPDGVEAARMCGIESFLLTLPMSPECDAEDLAELLDVDALVVTLPARRTGDGSDVYLQAVQEIVDSALYHRVPRIVFTSSTSVYGSGEGVMKENAALRPDTDSGRTLVALESWLHDLPGTAVDIVRLAGLVGPGRHPGRFLAGKTDLSNGGQGVNLVHLDDVVDALLLLLNTPPKGGRIWNLCAARHPSRAEFYPSVARRLGVTPPTFAPEATPSRGKLIDGSKICDLLGFAYRYSDPFTMPVS